MTPERWQQIKRILDAATACSLRRRQKWLDDACGDDAELRRDVESFLAHEERLEGFIEEPALPFLAERPDKPDAGRRIGAYRTVRLLGRGGMGAVYLAEREDEFEQRVALKLLPFGLDSDDMIRRFHNERQILAHLEHPHIARLLDGGTSDDGLPYFAMEYVEGEPIDAYCDERRLTVRQRLELFLEVCSALEFAHRNLVVHRDLKPGNVLVDAAGTPKLLDFGIAKLLQSSAAGALWTVATGPGQRAMTPRYASPEHFLEEPMTTASDIYSLGLLLYQLLTGRLPCRLESRGYAQVMKAICEEEPLRPSEAIGETEEILRADGSRVTLTPETVSRARDGDPRTLRRRLAGDVDAIVLKALRKRPRQRYASVEQLAADVRRHLRGLPVRAHQRTLAYRAGKFVRRNRWRVAAAAAVLLLVVGFTVALVFQLQRAERERHRAEQVSAFLQNLFLAADPDRSAGEELTARQILDRGRRDLEAGLGDEPEIRATLANTLGQVYYKLGHYAEARELLQAAVELRRQQHGVDHPALATALNDLANASFELRDLAAAEAFNREAIAMRRRLGDEENLIKPTNQLARILMTRGELAEAEEIYRRNLAWRRAHLAGDHPNVATSARNLAVLLLARGDPESAEPLLLEALDIRRRRFGPRTPAVAAVLHSLGELERARGRFASAEDCYREALDIRRQALGEGHRSVALTKRDLAALLLARGEWAAARPLLSEALATLYRDRREGDWQVAEAESVLGAYLAARGRFAEAEVCLLPSYRALAATRGPQVITTEQARQRVVELYEAWGQPAKADEYRAAAGRTPPASAGVAPGLSCSEVAAAETTR